MSFGKSYRQRIVHLIGAALILAIAFWGQDIRWARAAATLQPDGASAEAPAWLIDDPDAAYHLRRIEVALVAGTTPSEDRFLSFPNGSPVPWPPFFDGLLAMNNRLATGKPGAMGLTDTYEADLEARAAGTPPILGFLATLAVALAAGFFVRRCRPNPECMTRGYVVGPTAGAALAALIYATSPIAVWYADAGRIDHHVFVALLLALHFAMIAQVFAGGHFESVRSPSHERSLDATLGGLTAGLLAGFALLTWLPSAIFVGLAGLTFWMAACGRCTERVADARRAGMLYFMAAGLVTLVPAWLSPWNAVQPWSLVNLTRGVPLALFVASIALALPCMLPGLCTNVPERNSRQRLIGFAIPPLVALLAFVLLPGFSAGVQEGLAWATRGNLFMDVVAESRPLVEVGSGSLLRGILIDHGWAGVAVPIVVIWLAFAVRTSMDPTRGGPRPESRFYLLINLVVFAYLAIEQRRFGNSLAVPLAVGIGCICGFAVGRIENCYTQTLRMKAIAMGGLLLSCALAFGAFSGGRALAHPDAAALEDTRAWRHEIVAGLRWMRDHTPSPGVWNIAEAEQSYCVLSSWAMGHLVEYHARRPIVATNFGSFVGEENFQASASALLKRNPEVFLDDLEALGADYVVVTPRMASDFASQARIAALPPAERASLFTKKGGKKTFSAASKETAVWRLAVTSAGDAPTYPGLERVYASKETESIFGGNKPGPSGPVISIWRVK